MMAEPRLSHDTVKRLFSRHVVGVDHAEMERISGDFQRVMGGIAESAAQTGDSAGLYRGQLQELSQALLEGDGSGATTFIKDVMLGTSKMEHSAQALQSQVNASRSEVMRLQAELGRVRNEALLDPLTRILNRRGFDQEIAAMQRVPAKPETSHCLVMIDIDHFKKVNDTHGHVTGDRVIQALGEVLKQTVTDPSHAVARYGGEEFAVMMPHSSLTECARMSELIRTRVKSMKVRNKKTLEVMLTVTVSLGFTSLQDDDDASTLIARADAALYQSKQGGRDRVTAA
jgi:diguanylate cyclase